MLMYDLIKKKRDGFALDDEEIEFFVKGATDGSIPDYQVAAMCMAIFFQNMNDHETSILTDRMMHSGDVVDLSMFGDKTVDKHSTGGVGDKTSMVITPIVASIGAKVAKMTARGLGHTGGTIDKLESIKGFDVNLTAESFVEQVDKIGIALMGQTKNLAPADKVLYALRDVTATVDSIPLIASSIMSKKLASGAKSIVLDVKYGSGSFMKDPEDALTLATKMVNIGTGCNRNVAALVTNMDRPLGKNIGNALEVREAVKVLKNESDSYDLIEVCKNLATYMIMLSLGFDHDKAYELVCDAITSGKAYDKFCEWTSYQGGDIDSILSTNEDDLVKHIIEIKADKAGYISHMDTEKVGITSLLLGAGREKKEDDIDHNAGIILTKKTSDYVEAGEVIAKHYTNKDGIEDQVTKMYMSAVTITDEKPEEIPLIYKIISNLER